MTRVRIVVLASTPRLLGREMNQHAHSVMWANFLRARAHRPRGRAPLARQALSLMVKGQNVWTVVRDNTPTRALVSARCAKQERTLNRDQAHAHPAAPVSTPMLSPQRPSTRAQAAVSASTRWVPAMTRRPIAWNARLVRTQVRKGPPLPPRAKSALRTRTQKRQARGCRPHARPAGPTPTRPPEAQQALSAHAMLTIQGLLADRVSHA